MIRPSWYPPLVSGSAIPIQEPERPSQYSHVIKAVGGYWSATMNYAANPSLMDDWILNGIGRHLRVSDDTLSPCWEGFVNQVDAVYGNLSVTRGPLMMASNRLMAVFTTVDTTLIPPTEGVEMDTGWADHAASQAAHGVLPNVVSVSETNLADATNVRDGYLARNAWPRTTQLWGTAGGQVPSLTISCLGYVHWLFYVYNQLVNTGTINTDAKITDILTGTDAATGNPYNLNDAWLPFGTSHVDAPATPAAVPRYEFEDHTAWELIQGLVARGDAATPPNRWNFGVYDDREAWYQQAPTTVEYTAKLADPAQRIYAMTEVKPWRVRPGAYVRFTDFLANAPAFPTLDDDPRVGFIEDVTYTMPSQVTLRCDVGLELSEIMASYGLGGIGV